MGYYDQRENILEYIKALNSHSGQELIDSLKIHLPEQSSVLEIGMGSGKYLNLLKGIYNVTGSDKSRSFLDLYRENYPSVNLLSLNAIDLNTKQTFDAIFSNKVLHHLYKDELNTSIQNQLRVLNPNGIIAHTFWTGDKEDDYFDLHSVYYKPAAIRAYFEKYFDILHFVIYTEENSDDSMYIIAKKRRVNRTFVH